jgi:hypothetical protein
MEKKPSRLDEQTTITVGLLIIIIGGIVRVENTRSRALASEDRIVVLEKKNDEYAKVITDVRLSLVQIKTKLGIPVNEIQEPTSR